MIRLPLVGVVVALLSTASIQADSYIFTVEGVVNRSDSTTYSVNDVVTFTFTSSAVTSPASVDANSYYWDNAGLSSGLWDSISVSGLFGSWQQVPTSYEFLYLIQDMGEDYPFFQVLVSNNSAEIGFTLDGEDVVELLLQGLLPGIPFVWGTPNASLDYFASYLGTHTYVPLANTFSTSSIMTMSRRTVDFDVTKLTIAVIPEPSTGLILVGGAAMLAALRRRR